jgi:hypothetical protein
MSFLPQVRVNKKLERVQLEKNKHFVDFVQSGGLFVRKLITHLCDYVSDEFTDCDIYFLQVLKAVMQNRCVDWQNKIDDYEIGKLEGQREILKSDLIADLKTETDKLQALQRAFVDLGAGHMVVRVVSIKGNVDTHESDTALGRYYTAMSPKVVEVGIALVETGTRYCQDDIINWHRISRDQLHKVERSFLSGMRTILRQWKQELLDGNMESFSKLDREVFVSRVINLLRFLQLMCEGHNEDAQVYLRQQGENDNVNIVAEVSSFVQVCMTKITNEFEYLENPYFNNFMAPELHQQLKNTDASGKKKRRRLIAWHKMNDFDYLSGLCEITIQAFDTLTEFVQGPVLENQIAAVQSEICDPLTDMLEFLGSMAIFQPLKKKLASWPYDKLTKQEKTPYLSITQKPMTNDKTPYWSGSDPALCLSLYQTLLDEKKIAIGAGEKDRINEALRGVSSVESSNGDTPSSSQTSLSSVAKIAVAASNFKNPVHSKLPKCNRNADGSDAMDFPGICKFSPGRILEGEHDTTLDVPNLFNIAKSKDRLMMNFAFTEKGERYNDSAITTMKATASVTLNVQPRNIRLEMDYTPVEKWGLNFGGTIKVHHLDTNDVRVMYLVGERMYDPAGLSGDPHASERVGGDCTTTQFSIFVAECYALLLGAKAESVGRIQKACEPIIKSYHGRLMLFWWMWKQIQKTIIDNEDVTPYPDFILDSIELEEDDSKVEEERLHTMTYLRSYKAGSPKPPREYFSKVIAKDAGIAGDIGAANQAKLERLASKLNRQESADDDDDDEGEDQDTITAIRTALVKDRSWVHQRKVYYKWLNAEGKSGRAAITSSHEARAVVGEPGAVETNVYFKLHTFKGVMHQFEKALLNLLLGLLEGQSVEDAEVSKTLVQSLDEDVLISNLANRWERWRRESSRTERTERSKYALLSGTRSSDATWEERDLAFTYARLVMALNDNNFSPTIKSKFQEWASKGEINLDLYLGRVEVIGVSGNIEVIYYVKPDLVRRNWGNFEIQEIKETILYPTSFSKRDNPEEKVKDFLIQAENMIDVLQHLDRVSDYKYRSFAYIIMFYIGKQRGLWGYLALIMVFVVNVLLLWAAEYDKDATPDDAAIDDNVLPKIQYGDFHLAISVSGYLNLAFTILMFISYAIMKGYNDVKLGMELHLTRAKEISTSIASAGGHVGGSLNLQKPFVATYKGRNFIAFLNAFKLLGRDRQGNRRTQVSVRWPNWCWGLYYFYSTSGFFGPLYYTFLLVVSIISNIGNYDVFFAFLLIDVVRLSKLMRYVLYAIGYRIDQLLTAVLLMLFFIYWFVVVYYNQILRKGSAYEIEDQGECQSLSECLFLHLNYGLIQQPIWTSDPAPQVGFIFNLLYVITINLIFSAIVSGIIIDTFSEFRDTKRQIEDDLNDRCFICNIDREIFEQHNLNFAKHIKNDHNMWQYLSLQLYLEEKDPTEFTGQEAYVYEALVKNSTHVMPLKKARVVQEVRLKQDINGLFSVIRDLGSSIDSQFAEFNHFKENLLEMVKNKSTVFPGSGGAPAEGV